MARVLEESRRRTAYWSPRFTTTAGSDGGYFRDMYMNATPRSEPRVAWDMGEETPTSARKARIEMVLDVTKSEPTYIPKKQYL